MKKIIKIEVVFICNDVLQKVHFDYFIIVKLAVELEFFSVACVELCRAFWYGEPLWNYM